MYFFVLLRYAVQSFLFQYKSALPYQSYRQPRRIAEKPGPWSSRRAATERRPTAEQTLLRGNLLEKQATGSGRIPQATVYITSKRCLLCPIRMDRYIQGEIQYESSMSPMTTVPSIVGYDITSSMSTVYKLFKFIYCVQMYTHDL